jgi:hypothetical protein
MEYGSNTDLDPYTKYWVPVTSQAQIMPKNCSKKEKNPIQ